MAKKGKKGKKINKACLTAAIASSKGATISSKKLAALGRKCSSGKKKGKGHKGKKHNPGIKRKARQGLLGFGLLK
jgi:hypothetical protein